jgi:hypothetical protein
MYFNFLTTIGGWGAAECMHVGAETTPAIKEIINQSLCETADELANKLYNL